MKRALVFGASLATLLAVARLGLAQQAPIAYPSAGQSMEQQAQDEADCRNIATQATGVSPYSTPPEYYSGGTSGPGALGGAARGAALGAVGGAIAGDAGKGAAIGAAVGGTAGIMRKNRQRRQEAQADQQAYNAYQADLQKYNQSFAACMSSRGYVMR
ncbi:glycine zipper family protein [Dongia sp. agr-C8]